MLKAGGHSEAVVTDEPSAPIALELGDGAAGAVSVSFPFAGIGVRVQESRTSTEVGGGMGPRGPS